MTNRRLLLAIVAIAALLRLANLGSGDVTGSDEALYAFRAVGMLDYDVAEFQPTPLELSDPDIPWWTKFSFHDHPPLVFFAQNIFMKVFGENNFGFRLPSAILGILSVWLIYLVAREIYRRVNPVMAPVFGLVAAAILAVTVNHVYISRLGIQEAYVIFFLLLASYLFLRSLEEDRYLLWLGAALGLAFLTKYTAFILVPIFLTYLMIFRRSPSVALREGGRSPSAASSEGGRSPSVASSEGGRSPSVASSEGGRSPSVASSEGGRDYLKKRRFWLAVLIAFVIASPIVIYNIGLYARFGHFDFQISFVLGQDPEIWKVAPGKEEIGTLGDRLRNFIPNFYHTNSWLLASIFFLTIPIFAIFYLKKPREFFRQRGFLDIALVWLVLLLLVIGPTNRFLTMLSPFIAIAVTWPLIAGYQKFLIGRLKPALIILAVFLGLEILYSFNGVVAAYPLGPQFWTWSRVRFDAYNWGYNELGRFLKKELAGKMPAISFNMRYRFLQEVSGRALANARLRGLQPFPALVVYDDNVQNAAQLWALDRLQIYHGWPVLKLQGYLQMLDQLGSDFFNKTGFRNYYFITPTDKVPWKKNPTNLGLQFEQQLAGRGILPIVLKNKRGEDVFRVYKWSNPQH